MFDRIVTGDMLAGFIAVKSIRAGYPARILKSASSFFGVTHARIQSIAQVSATTANGSKKNAHIDSAATERAFRMGAVTCRLIDMFEQQASAIEWMHQPNSAPGNAAPLDWAVLPAPSSAQELGRQRLTSNSELVMLPSAVIS